MPNYNRVVVTQQIKHTDGRLLVEKGAKGTIVSSDQGLVHILFDDDGVFVELSGCKQRLQRVPFIYTATEKEGENMPKIERYPTREELGERLRTGTATNPISRVNHEEYIADGTRYFCAYSSERDTTYKPEKRDDPPYKVLGWCTYKAEPEIAEKADA